MIMYKVDRYLAHQYTYIFQHYYYYYYLSFIFTGSMQLVIPSTALPAMSTGSALLRAIVNQPLEIPDRVRLVCWNIKVDPKTINSNLHTVMSLMQFKKNF
jgi:hypothetical protein